MPAEPTSVSVLVPLIGHAVAAGEVQAVDRERLIDGGRAAGGGEVQVGDAAGQRADGLRAGRSQRPVAVVDQIVPERLASRPSAGCRER